MTVKVFRQNTGQRDCVCGKNKDKVKKITIV